MDDKIKISFDNEYKIRVLDPVKYSKAEELQKESSAFTEKITQFNEKVVNLVDILEKHAARIDSEKLRVR
jgi:intraflagellar transport protein 20